MLLSIIKNTERYNMNYLVTKIDDDEASFLGIIRADDVVDALEHLIDNVLIERGLIVPTEMEYHWKFNDDGIPGVFIDKQLSYLLTEVEEL